MSGGHGGRRAGAGRPSGSGWKPAIIKMRAVSAEQKAQIIGSDRDPMHFLVDMVWDENLDLQTRLSAAAIVVPYLHPRLSATQVQANHTVTRIDSAQLLDRIAERIERLAAPPAIDGEAAPAEVPEPAPSRRESLPAWPSNPATIPTDRITSRGCCS